MKLIVTGGMGFIGSAVVRQAINAGHQVLNIDKLTYASCTKNVSAVADSPLYNFAQIDICDAAALKAVFMSFSPDAVMHLAAESHVDRSINGPAEFIRTNIMGTYELLQAARTYWDENGRDPSFRFHHVSTDEVYGSLTDEGLFHETSPYKPNSPYSASKASSDHLVRAWHETYGLPVVVTNCSNNYGPFQFPEKLIPVTIINALSNKPIPIYGAGNNVRDWLYVEDHADALLNVLANGKNGGTYNIGGNNEMSNLALVNQLLELLDEKRGSNQSYKRLIKHVEDRAGHDYRYAIDATYISDELDWKPSVSVSEGLELTVDWYLKNESWWRGLLTNAASE